MDSVVSILTTERASDVEVGAGGTDMNVDFYGGDFKIDLNEPELG